MANNSNLSDRRNRVKEIIAQFDTDEVPLDEGQQLHEEGRMLLTEIWDILSDGEGEVIEIE